jgi:hypothetical protein
MADKGDWTELDETVQSTAQKLSELSVAPQQ